jgi:hypothetical protein
MAVPEVYKLAHPFRLLCAFAVTGTFLLIGWLLDISFPEAELAITFGCLALTGWCFRLKWRNALWAYGGSVCDFLVGHSARIRCLMRMHPFFRYPLPGLSLL